MEDIIQRGCSHIWTYSFSIFLLLYRTYWTNMHAQLASNRVKTCVGENYETFPSPHRQYGTNDESHYIVFSNMKRYKELLRTYRFRTFWAGVFRKPSNTNTYVRKARYIHTYIYIYIYIYIEYVWIIYVSLYCFHLHRLILVISCAVFDLFSTWVSVAMKCVTCDDCYEHVLDTV